MRFDGNGQANTRLAITGCQFRTIGLEVSDFSIVHVASNLVAGPSNWEFGDISTRLNFLANTFWNNATVTIDALTAATPKFAANDISGLNLTNNSGQAEIMAANV